MSAPPKKPVPTNPNARRTSTDNTATSNLPNRTPTRSPAPTTANGLGRSPSIRSSNTPVSARAAARKPPGHRSQMSTSALATMSTDSEYEDQKAENAALIDDLKYQLQKAETASDEYLKQLGVLQSRLDDALHEQGKLEEQAHEKDGKIEMLETQLKESARQQKVLEQTYEADRSALLKEKEQQAAQEEELLFTIQRLKESLTQKDLRSNVETEASFRHRSSPDIENGQFAPSAALHRSPSRNNSKVILHKDKVIESLRLELAEAQIRLVEMENAGDGRWQELERQLLETRMANARLMEDNESFQLLLSEKTLNGDFTKSDFMHEGRTDDKPQQMTSLGSLADELESAGEDGDAGDAGENENYRRMEAELKSLRDQNKALTLYIERIIGRLLQHEGFEHILDKADSPEAPSKPIAAPTPAPAPVPAPASAPNTEKDLPPPPPAKDEPAETPGPGFLQRARSVLAGPGKRPTPGAKSRPVSYVPATTHTAHEDPRTAPSIPLGRSNTTRGHQRSRSDQADGSAAAVVSQMYRGPPANANIRTTSSGPMSPAGVSPGSPSLGPRNSNYFQLPVGSSGASGTGTSPAVSRVTSSTGAEHRPGSSSGSVLSEHSGEPGDKASPPRPNNYTGAVMTQTKMRPLRLLQENNEAGLSDQGGVRSGDDEEANMAKRKANRGSWMGWMGSLARVGTANVEETQTPRTPTGQPLRDGSRERSVE